MSVSEIPVLKAMNCITDVLFLYFDTFGPVRVIFIPIRSDHCIYIYIYLQRYMVSIYYELILYFLDETVGKRHVYRSNNNRKLYLRFIELFTYFKLTTDIENKSQLNNDDIC